MSTKRPTPKKKPGLRFEAVNIAPLFEMLDAVAWLDSPSTKEIAQYANVDPRTAGKILKNAGSLDLSSHLMMTHTYLPNRIHIEAH